MGDVNHEPTMEEILASIKKIIAEDGEQAVSEPDERPRRKRPVLETAEPPVSEMEPEDVLELTDEVEAEAAERSASGHSDASDPIVSDEAAKASQAALAALTSITKPDVGSGDTHPLEGLVREMLRPMLKEWLDENLPGLVEELVAREIARIAAGRD